MKKLIAFALIIVTLAISFASCEGENTPEATTYSYYTSKITPIATEPDTTGGTSTTTPTNEPSQTLVSVASSRYHGVVEARSRILLFQPGTLYYYSKADGESYPFCFNPLCQHTFKENCTARSFMSHRSTNDGFCVYSEKYNRFYFARGQNIYSSSFDASDFKLEISFGENGKIGESLSDRESLNYDFAISNLRIYDDYIYFRRSNNDNGKYQMLRYNIATHKYEELTSADDEWILGYEIADGYIYFKTFDADFVVKYYTTDFDFKERKEVPNPVNDASANPFMGLYFNGYFYERLSGMEDGELYKINPLTGEKVLIVKDERLSHDSSETLCVNKDGVYFSAWESAATGIVEDDIQGRHEVGTTHNNIWRISFDGEFTKVLDFPRGEIETMNFVNGGVIIHFSRIYHKEINVEYPDVVGNIYVLFEIDDNGHLVNPKSIGNSADNEDLIALFEGDWHGKTTSTPTETTVPTSTTATTESTTPTVASAKEIEIPVEDPVVSGDFSFTQNSD